MEVPFVIVAYVAIVFGGLLAGYSEKLEELGTFCLFGGFIVTGLWFIDLPLPWLQEYLLRVICKFFGWFLSLLIAMLIGLVFSNLLLATKQTFPE